MTSQAVNAFGTILSMNGTEIAEVRSIGGPKLSRATLEATHHTSEDMWREFKKGLKDGGEVSMELNFMPFNATHQAILADFSDDTTIAEWVMTFPDSGATQWSFDAIVTAFEPSQPFDELLTASTTLKVTGKPTLA
jgi:predicted secreted protein